MKIQSMIKFLSLLSLPLLQSCGGPATTDAKLSVSSSFVATAGSLGLGGYIVVGENQTTSKKFILSLAGSTQTKVQLEKGQWRFAAIGWDGITPFEGNAVCGAVPSVDLTTADTATVEIQVNSTACTSAALVSELNVKSIAPLACDIFYNYSQSTNTFSPLSGSFSDSFCNSLPNDYRSDFTQYRLQSLNINNGKETPGFISECKSLTTATSLNLPLGKIPVLMKFFKNGEDCNNNRAAQSYLFRDGIALGNPNFDHLINAAGTRLLLSSARTKRGKSPFMAEIPRVLCGSSGSFTDCLAEPTLNAHINVPFNNYDNRDVAILRGVSPLINTCDPATILAPSKFFSAETCSVKDREIRIKPVRNELLCQASPFFSGPFNIKDLYQREGKTYLLVYKGPPLYKSFVMVYSKAGKLLAEYDLGSVIYDELAVSNDGSKMVVINTNDAYFMTINSGAAPSGLILSGKGGNQVEIDPAGNAFYLANGSYVKSYNSTGAMIASSEPVTGQTVSLMHLDNGQLYVINENMEVRKAAVSAGSIGVYSATLDVLSWIPNSFTVSGGKGYYQYNSQLYYSLFNNSLPSYTMSLSTGAIATSVMDGKVYFAKDQGISVYVNGVNDSLISSGSGCNETISLTQGGTTKALNIESHQNQPLLPIWADGLRLLGKRYFIDTDKPFYYFESLADHDDGVRTGGKLDRVQEMLGPEALGGFLSQFNSCADVKAAAPFTKTHTFIDESKGEIMNFTLSVDPNSANEMMPNYICDDFNQNATCSPSATVAYDLILNFNHLGDDHREKMRIKLKCGSQKGTFESADVEYSPSDIRNELLVWNTASDTAARYEEYTLEQNLRKRGTVTRLRKTSATGVFARWVEVELNGAQKSGSVVQYEIAGSQVFTGRQHVSKNLTDFNNGDSTLLAPAYSYSFNDIVDNIDFFSGFFAEGPAITLTSSTDIYGTTGSGGYFSDQVANSTMSKSIPLSISDMNIDDSSHPLVLAPGDPGAIFELTP